MRVTKGKNMKKNIIFIIISTLIASMQLLASDPSKPVLVRSTSNFPKEVQKQIAQLELQAATANQASLDAEEVADKKDADLKILQAKSAQEETQMSDLSTELSAAQKALEDLQAKQSLAYKEAAAQTVIAAQKEIEAAAAKKEIARLKKEGASQIADAATKKRMIAEADKDAAQASQLDQRATSNKTDAAKLQSTASSHQRQTNMLLGQLNKDIGVRRPTIEHEEEHLPLPPGPAPVLEPHIPPPPPFEH